MHTLGIDIETYSSTSLKRCGMHRYVEDDNFEILLISYQFNDEPIKTIDLATNGNRIPRQFVDWLQDPDVQKTAWNVSFEFTCLCTALDLQLDLKQWKDTMIVAAMAGYPLSLEEAAKALKIEAQKDRRGKACIKFFSEPSKVPRSNPVKYVRHRPKDNPALWRDYIAYNQMDVRVEQQIKKTLSWFKYPSIEDEYWFLDQKINSEGIMLDVQLIHQAIALAHLTHEGLDREAKEITGLANPNSTPQLREWLEKETGDRIYNLQKENIKTMLDEYADRPKIKRVLEIRQQISKSSVKKYKPMSLCASSRDHRARGLIQFYGAQKTGRYASRLIQIHNLVKNKMKGLDDARRLIREGDFDTLQLLFGNLNMVLSELCRTAFIPKPGHEFLVTDFSAIEARVLAWFAREIWRLEVFGGDGKIYEASGAKMFKTTPDKVAADRDGLRFKAKTAELALGFQGGVGAINRMEQQGLKTGLKEEEKQPLIDAWRKANPNIVRFWYDVEECALNAVRYPGKLIVLRNLKFFVKYGTLFIKLPSDRCLTYPKVHLTENKFDKEAVGFFSLDQKTNRWVHQDTYGGKLVENIVQGTSRDLLAAKMHAFDLLGWSVVMHVHDELVFEIRLGEKAKRLIEAGEIMSQKLPWTSDLPLAAESYCCPYYIKH